MSPPELLEALLELAGEVGLEVRRVGSGPEAPATSGVCRLRDRVYVLLAGSDPVDRRVAVLAGALRVHAGEACESRYLPPALRAALEAGAAPRRSINPP